MSKIINELATIKVSNEVLDQLSVGDIFQKFKENYQKLDDLKRFRGEYERQNFLMRWWNNDQLRDAQLDSAEVQAEFSKVIGQLMVISIMQSKKLFEQQTQLNDQQGNLKNQADGIANHAKKLQAQHQELAEQSKRLEDLMHNYFELKGLTEEGAQKLIEIAREVKATKDKLLDEFNMRSKEVEKFCAEVSLCVKNFSVQMDKRIRQDGEKIQAEISSVKNETREMFAAGEKENKKYQDAVWNVLIQYRGRLEESRHELEGLLQEKHSALELGFAECVNDFGKKYSYFDEKIAEIKNSIEATSFKLIGLRNDLVDMNGFQVRSDEQQKKYQNSMQLFERKVTNDIRGLWYLFLMVLVMAVVALGLMARAVGLI